MAQISYDPNKAQQQNTTDVLGGQQAQPQSQPSAQTEIASNASTPAPAYVSDGNPYGKYASSANQPTGNTQQSSRKTSGGGASSGQFTNVQSYIDKNKQSSQNLGQAVAGKLQTTADIAKQNLSQVQNKFQQGVQAGGVQDSATAVTDVQKAAQEASTAQAPEKVYQSREAGMYTPTKQTDGTYSPEDQALIASNKARVTYGDGSYKDYATQAEATAAMNQYNASNPGYYTYGEQAPLSVSEDRLSSILNAKYTGPTDLSNIAGYGKAYNLFQDASQLQGQALKGGNQSELLKRTFERPTSQYTQGSQLLDQLLLGQGKANEILQTTAKGLGESASGKLSDELRDKVKQSLMTSTAKGQETEKIREDSRKMLSDVFSGREAEVNARINDVMKDWEKYPQYFRDRFQDQLKAHEVKQSQYGNIMDQVTSKTGLDKTKFMDYYNKYESSIKSMSDQDLNKFLSGMGVSLRFGKVPTNNKDLEQLRAVIGGDKAHQDNILAAMKFYESNEGLANQLRSDFGNYKDSIGAADHHKVASYMDKISNILTQSKQLSNSGMANFDPNAMNLGLSQLEAQALGIQGGEGLYNLLKQPQGIENLLKTATADKNKLISGAEQNQLARLQSIAQLAKDYGASGSGLEKVVNKFTERDLAGTQSATDALDMDNFKRLLQGSERSFRNEAASSNISGAGYGTGSSRGLFGSRGAQAWKTLTENLGNVIQRGGGYRNIYSDAGVNKDLLKQAAQASAGKQTANIGVGNPGIVGGITDYGAALNNLLNDKLSTGNSLADTAIQATAWTNPVTAPLAMANILGSTLGGSKAAAQSEADYNAYQDALNKLRSNITSKINETGLKNQLTVNKNTQQDLELFKLLGLLDQTNM